MDKFFHPRSIAVVGASKIKNKIGNILMKNLESQKNIKVYPVNPGNEVIMGLKAYGSVLDIEKDVDLAVIAVPAKFVVKVVQECAWRAQPIKNIVIISAGFSETGKEGIKREEELAFLAKEHGLQIMGPNCLGLINATSNLNVTFAKSEVKKGSVGLIMQSGALTTALLDISSKKHFGFSLIATLGNKLIVDESDLIEYYAKDKNTKIIALYLEDIRDGKRFKDVLCRIAPRKPIVIIKSGSSKRARVAIQSHTGAMAGEADVVKEVVKENGGIFCDNLLDFVAVIKLLDGFAQPRNNKVAIITNAGGPGVITTDLIENTTLILHEFGKSRKSKLRKVLPSESSVENPIDVLGDAEDDRYKGAIDAIATDQGLGSILAIVTPQAQTPIEKIARVISVANKKYSIPIVPVFIGGEAAENAMEVLSKEGFYNFSFSFEAVRALEKYQQSSKAIMALKSISSGTEVNRRRMGWSTKFLSEISSTERKVLFYHEAEKIGSKYGLNILSAQYPESLNQIGKAKFSYPVVAKIDSPKILHKFDKEGVVLNIRNSGELDRARKSLKKRFGEDGEVLVQAQIEPGMELIMGIKKDDAFGQVLMLGLGGIFTEALNKKLLWMLPARKVQIEEKIKNSVFEKVLNKQRIRTGVVIEELVKLAQLGTENPRIKELDINPIMVYSDKPSMIVDFKIVLE